MDYEAFRALATTTFADVLTREQVMNISIRPLWEGIPRVAGAAYTVKCAPGDNLMLHAAIHRAPPGAVIVVEAGDLDYAVAGGNVCAVAQKRGIAGFVIDGLIRDLAEVRENRFPVFGRGVIPIPGGKDVLDVLNDAPVRCGGVVVAPGDIVVADEEGVIVIPAARQDEVLKAAQAKAAKDAAETLESWERTHEKRINEILQKKGYKG